MGNPNHAALRPHRISAFAQPCSQCLPHLTGTVLRIPELVNESFGVAIAARKNRTTNRSQQRESLDALRRPLSTNGGARHAPHFLGVCFEKNLVKPPPKPIRNPILQVFFLRRRPELRLEVAAKNSRTLEHAETKQSILRD